MAKGRWYPPVTLLADGGLVTVAGRDTTKAVVTIPEIWETGQWVQLPGASLELPYYPRDFLAPDGRVFYAGERIVSRWLDVDASTVSGRRSIDRHNDQAPVIPLLLLRRPRPTSAGS